MKAHFMDKGEIKATVDKALLMTTMEYSESWISQGGKETALPAHVFQNKTVGAKNLRDMIFYLIDDLMEDDPDATP